jgi:hypothetical protein
MLFFIVLFFLNLYSKDDRPIIELSKPSYYHYNCSVLKLNYSKKIERSPYFQKAHEISINLRKELEKLLDFSGFCNIVFSDLNSSQTKKTKDIHFLIFGDIDISKKKIITTMKFKNISSNDKIFSKKFDKTDDINMIAKDFIDSLFIYFNKNKFFNSKLIFVGRKTETSSNQIFISDIDGKNLKQITNFKNMKKDIFHVIMTQDKRYILYNSHYKYDLVIFILDLHAKKNRTKIFIKGDNPSYLGNIYKTRNQEKIVFSMSNKIFQKEIGSYKKVRFKAFDIIESLIANNGDFLIYTSNLLGNPKLFFKNLSNNKQYDGYLLKIKEYLKDEKFKLGVTSPALSTDNKKLAFVFENKTTNIQNIYMIDFLNNKNTKQITNCNFDCEKPIWGPNSRFIVFQSNEIKNKYKSNWQLNIIDSKGAAKSKKIDLKLYFAKNAYWWIDNAN